MAAKAIELILSRQWADSLSVPIFLVDSEGNLLFYNEPAEVILGSRFENTGPLPVKEWSTMFKPQDSEGKGIPPEGLPLVKTLTNLKPAQGSFWIESLNGKRFHLSVTSFPVIGQAQRPVGAIAIFWEIED